MTTNTLVNETLTVNHPGSNSLVNNNGPIAHLDHMLNSLHDEQTLTRLSNVNGSIDPYDSKSHRVNPRSSSRNNITDGKIIECSSENSIVYRYYSGESTSIIDEHFDKSLKQPTSNGTRSLTMRESNDLLDSRNSSYGYPPMMGSSSGFWPNFIAPSTSYPHPTYLPTSQTDYSDWMHHHTYRSPYSTNSQTAGSSSSTMVPSMNNTHLHPMGSPTSSGNTNSNNNRYLHHAPSDMDVVTAAAIGAAAAAQMFHHEKQSHHAYTPTTHHFDYHLGGSMMTSTPYGFTGQGFDLMSSSSSSLNLDNSNMKEATTSAPWYSNHHLSCQ